jgi:hypothetical protein
VNFRLNSVFELNCDPLTALSIANAFVSSLNAKLLFFEDDIEMPGDRVLPEKMLRMLLKLMIESQSANSLI